MNSPAASGVDQVSANHAAGISCKEITDHDLDNAVKVGRAKWVCPKCGKDISLAYVFYCAALEYEQEQ